MLCVNVIVYLFVVLKNVYALLPLTGFVYFENPNPTSSFVNCLMPKPKYYSLLKLNSMNINLNTETHETPTFGKEQ